MCLWVFTAYLKTLVTLNSQPVTTEDNNLHMVDMMCLWDEHLNRFITSFGLKQHVT